VILTRSRLCPGPKPGSSLHLHVLSTPPAFVLSQDQTLRKKSDVTWNARHKRVVMSLTRHRVHNPAADMTELFNPHPVHGGRGSGSSNEGREPFVARCSVFKDRLAGSTGLVASMPCSGHEKGPSSRGARYGTAGVSGWSWTPRYEAAPLENRRKSDPEV
jgi:hypothetical protein